MRDDTPTVKVALIGLGKMGLFHLALLRSHPRVDVRGICDTSEFLRNALKPYLMGPRFYADAAAMLEKEDIDTVYITTPTDSHAALALLCAKQKKHLFIEKPMAESLADALPIAALVRQHQRQLHIGYVCRYTPTFIKAKSLIDSGALGRLLNVQGVKYSSDILRRVENNWRVTRKGKNSGGLLNEFACHGLDLFAWMFGEPQQIQAQARSWYSRDVEDYLHTMLDYGQYIGTFDCSWSVRHYRKPYTRIDVIGENGQLSVTDTALHWQLHKSHKDWAEGENTWTVTDNQTPIRVLIGDAMYTDQGDDFIRSITENAAVEASLTDALRTQRLIDAVRESARRGS